MRVRILRVLSALAGAAVVAVPVFATELQGTSFKIIDPVIDVAGGRVSSSRFQLIEAHGQTAIGEGTSSTYTLRAGFLYFPEASKPKLTMSDRLAGRVLFEWTDSLGALGWRVASYDICYGTVSNTYSCRALGNVLRYVLTGLTQETQYFFRIRARDIFGNIIVRSDEVTLTPARGGGGGGAGAGSGVAGPSLPAPSPTPTPTPQPTTPPAVAVTLQGFAYPESRITIFQDSRAVATIEAALDAMFEATLPALQPGITYVLGIQAQDAQGRRSPTVPLTIIIPEIPTLTITDIFVPPTAGLSATVIQSGQLLRVSGQTFPGATVTVELLPERKIFTVKSDKSGAWTLGIKTTDLKEGKYALLISSTLGQFKTIFPQAITFEVRATLPKEERLCKGADINGDGRVNLIDFSAMLFFWKKTKPANPCADINRDGIVDLKDFSILLSKWTG